MALITCPECGAQISDRATSCPHCGVPVSSGTPIPPPIVTPPVQPTPPAQNNGPQVGLQTANLRCPKCGAGLEAKDIMSSGWAHCPSCGKDVQLVGVNNAFADGLIEKILPFSNSRDYFHHTCMQKLMDVGCEDIFDKILNIDISQKYFWVREFGGGNSREIYPMHNYGAEFFKSIENTPILSCAKYEKIFPTDKMVDFNSSFIQGKELLPKEMSSSECKYQYTKQSNQAYNPTPNYYCLPIFEETYSYNGKDYCFKGSGDTFMRFCWNDIPKDPIINGKPNYTDMTPVTLTVMGIGVLIAIAVVILAFSNGFWSGLFTLIGIGIVLAIVGSFVGTLILALTGGIDTIIQKTINSGRRKKFRKRYAEIQEHKKQTAKRMFNLDLTYDVPEFPIP